MSLSRYFVKKPIATIQAESQGSHLKRSLSAMNLVSLGIGCIIGAGIFVLTGQAAAQHAGPAIILSFVLAGAACAFAAFCYAELASVLPVSGSAYTYAYATLGEVFAWAMGWLLILEYGLASATVAVGWSGYLNSVLLSSANFMIPPELVNPFGEKITIAGALRPLYQAKGYLFDPEGVLLTAAGTPLLGLFNVPAFLGILGVTALLIVGISESAKVNNLIVLVKVAVVVLFIVVGLFYIDPSNWTPFIPETMPDPDPTKHSHYGYTGILSGAGAIFFAYIGFESVSTAAQEAKNPQRDMPIGILGSLAICTVLYMLVAAVLTGVVPYSQLNVPDPMAVAVDKIPVWGLSFVIKIGAIMGLTSVMLVLVYGQTRIFFMMAKDGLIPEFFGKIHPKFQTPYLNTVLVGICVGIAAGLTPIRVLGDLVSMGTLAAFIIVCFSVLYLRVKEPNLERPYRCPGMPVIPILGIAMCAYLMYGLGMHVLKQLWIWFAAGIVIYLAYGQFRSKLRRENRA